MHLLEEVYILFNVNPIRHSYHSLYLMSQQEKFMHSVQSVVSITYLHSGDWPLWNIGLAQHQDGTGLYHQEYLLFLVEFQRVQGFGGDFYQQGAGVPRPRPVPAADGSV